MKKLVIAALAIGVMAACTKQNVQYEPAGELTFYPVAQKATKATSTSTDYPATEKFNVWAWWGNVEPAAISGNDYSEFSTTYLDAATFANRTGTSNWGGDGTSYYWPTTGSLVFAGYSPSDAAGTYTYIFDNSSDPKKQTFTATDFVQSNDIKSTKDLMWFDVTKTSYDQNVSADKGIPAQFQHALSWLTFKFNLKESTTPTNWKVTNVTLKGIENKATFTAVQSTTNAVSWTAAVDATDSDDTDDDVVVFDLNAGHVVGYSAEGTVLEGTEVGSATKGSVIVIPQSCLYTDETTNDASLVITYDLKNPAGVSGDLSKPEWLTDQTITLPLNGTGVGKAWVAGTHYIYTITFGANEILIAPTVAEWATVPENIAVE